MLQQCKQENSGGQTTWRQPKRAGVMKFWIHWYPQTKWLISVRSIRFQLGEIRAVKTFARAASGCPEGLEPGWEPPVKEAKTWVLWMESQVVKECEVLGRPLSASFFSLSLSLTHTHLQTIVTFRVIKRGILLLRICYSLIIPSFAIQHNLFFLNCLCPIDGNFTGSTNPGQGDP